MPQSVSATEIDKIRSRFPSRIPVLVTKSISKGSVDLPNLPKNKFLVPMDMSVGQFIFIIRKQLTLSSEKALFLFVNNTLPTTGVTIKELYAQHASSDGLLRVIYTSESTFGA